jgi:HSP20 family protein
MTLIKYNPFADFDSIPGSLRLFEDTVNRMLSDVPTSRPWAPAVDILENEDELVVKADLPDVKLEDVDIRLENGTLTLKGERKFENSEEKGGYHRIERSYGSFTRCFSLPDSVDTEKVKAEYKNGVLSVTLPKLEVAKPKSVKVQVTNN